MRPVASIIFVAEKFKTFPVLNDLSILYCNITIIPAIAGTVNDLSVFNKNITGRILRSKKHGKLIAG